jgi:hypothetical protein
MLKLQWNLSYKDNCCPFTEVKMNRNEVSSWQWCPLREVPLMYQSRNRPTTNHSASATRGALVPFYFPGGALLFKKKIYIFKKKNLLLVIYDTSSIREPPEVSKCVKI